MHGECVAKNSFIFIHLHFWKFSLTSPKTLSVTKQRTGIWCSLACVPINQVLYVLTSSLRPWDWISHKKSTLEKKGRWKLNVKLSTYVGDLHDLPLILLFLDATSTTSSIKSMNLCEICSQNVPPSYIQRGVLETRRFAILQLKAGRLLINPFVMFLAFG